MKTLTELQKAETLVELESNMKQFIEDLPSDHPIGWIPDNMALLMAKAALNVVETVVDCNIYFEENPA